MGQINYKFHTTSATGFSFPFSKNKYSKTNWSLDELNAILDYKLAGVIGAGVAASNQEPGGNGWVGSINYYKTHQGLWVYGTENMTETIPITADIIRQKLVEFNGYTGEVYEYTYQDYRDIIQGGQNNLIGYPYFTDGLSCGTTGACFADSDGRHIQQAIHCPPQGGLVGASQRQSDGHWVGSYRPQAGAASWIYLQSWSGEHDGEYPNIREIFIHPEVSTDPLHRAVYRYGRVYDGNKVITGPFSTGIPMNVFHVIDVFMRNPSSGGYGIVNALGTQLISDEWCWNAPRLQRPAIVWGWGTSDNFELEPDITGDTLDHITLKKRTINNLGVTDTLVSFYSMMQLHYIVVNIAAGHGLPVENTSGGDPDQYTGGSNFVWIEGVTGDMADKLNGLRQCETTSATEVKFFASGNILSDPSDWPGELGLDISSMSWRKAVKGYDLTPGTNDPYTPTLTWTDATGPTDLTRIDFTHNRDVNGTYKREISPPACGTDHGMSGGSGFSTGTPSVVMSDAMKFQAICRGAVVRSASGSDLDNSEDPTANITLGSFMCFYDYPKWTTDTLYPPIGGTIKYRVYDPETQGWYSAKWVDGNGVDLSPQPKFTNSTGGDVGAVANGWGQSHEMNIPGLYWLWPKTGDTPEERAGLKLIPISLTN